MPRHLISDAHEWINEIPTVPIYYLQMEGGDILYAETIPELLQSKTASSRPRACTQQIVQSTQSIKAAQSAKLAYKISHFHCPVYANLNGTQKKSHRHNKVSHQLTGENNEEGENLDLPAATSNRTQCYCLLLYYQKVPTHRPYAANTTS